MLITTIDQGLEKLVRAALPMPKETGDVSFDAPDRTWGAQLSRITVNLFLFNVARSNQPSRGFQERRLPDGRIERSAPIPVVAMSYLVTAWAGSTSDEHELLGDVLGCFCLNQVLPQSHLPDVFEGSVQIAILEREGRRPGDVFSALDGRLRPNFELLVTAALDAPFWQIAAPLVDRVHGKVDPHGPDPADADPFARPKITTSPSRRRVGDGIVLEKQ